jgi:hypothetical protein
VQGQRLGGKSFSEKTSTLIVNAHGALIRLHEPVAAGQSITITNVKTSEQCSCRVVGSMTGQDGEPAVGVEFVEPSPRFWRVAFPPEDWTPRSPEAKHIEKRPEPPLTTKPR